MRRKWKCFVGVFMAVAVLYVMRAMPVYAAETIASGTFGEDPEKNPSNLWVLDSEGTLTIRGTGDIVHERDVALYGWEEYDEQIHTIIIQNGLTGIGPGAFYEFADLTRVEIPDSVTWIGSHAFENCVGLTDLVIPRSVKRIEEDAFQFDYYEWIYGRSNLNITIPKETRCAQDAFGSFMNVKSIVFEDAASIPPVEKSKGGYDYLMAHVNNDTDEVSLDFCDRGPETVTVQSGAIGEEAFATFGRLKKVNLGSKVTGIGKAAFAGTAVTEMSLPAGMTRLEAEAFKNCLNLRRVTGGGRVTTLGDYAFSGCGSLVEMYLGSSVKTIGSYAFDQCTALKEMVLPQGVTAIKDGTFRDCSGLSSVTIPGGVKSVGTDAFSGCVSLTSVTIPNGVKNIGNRAFRACRSLKSVKMPTGIKSIESSVFSDCSSLQSVEIPKGVERIGRGAFMGCSGLSKVTLPEGLISIEEEAFCDCTGLKKITVPKSVVTIENYSLGCYTENTGHGIARRFIKGFTIYGYDGTAAANYAKKYKTKGFKFVSLGTVEEASLKIGDVFTDKASKAEYKVTKEGKETAYKSPSGSGTSITIPATVKVNGVTYKVTSIAANAFKENKKITKVKIGSNVTSIGSSAFKNCIKLKSVTFGKKVKTIGTSAFSGCRALKKVLISSSALTKIGDSAFAGCTSMTSFTASSKKLTAIGKKAFYGDKKLAAITLKTEKLTKAKVGSNAFKGIKSTAKIKVPSKKLKEYKKILKGKGQGSKVKIVKL